MHMQLVTGSEKLPPAADAGVSQAILAGRLIYPGTRTIRRNGAMVGIEPGKISVAMTKALLAIESNRRVVSAPRPFNDGCFQNEDTRSKNTCTTSPIAVSSNPAWSKPIREQVILFHG